MPFMSARSDALSNVTHAQIDPTSVCDLNCGYCVGRTWKPGHLSVENFDSFVAQLPNLRYVQLQGEGEPLLGRGFWQYLERLRSANIDVGFITNGRHLSTKTIARLRALEIRTITVSIDSLDPETYRRLRGGDVKTILDGVHRLLSDRSERTDAFLAAVLTRSTFESLYDLREFSERVGLSPPSCQELQQGASYVASYRGVSLEGDALSTSQRAEMRKYLQWRAAERSRLGLKSYFESAMSAGDGDQRCPFVEHSLHLRYDGEIFPCCFIKETEHSLGAMSTDLDEFANARVAFQARIRRGETPPPCEGCHVLGPRYR